jgi:hypothetical protein
MFKLQKSQQSSSRYTEVVLMLLMGLMMTYTGNAAADAAATLRAKYIELLPQLERNAYQRPLYLDSQEASGKVRGDVYARLDHPYDKVAAALAKPATWCDILILHLNTKYCHAATATHGSVVSVHMGRKFDQPLEDTHRVAFAYRVVAATPAFLEIRLGAEQGPLSTRDYQIGIEAIPMDGDRTFLHFTYSYAYGIAGRLAMQGYLATLGRDKVGFTIVGRQADGQPQYVGGTLGAAERNTMRYYLAIEAYLGTLSTPPQQRMEKSFRDWFAATERYPRQLHEIEQDAYLSMKHKEYTRQQSHPPLAK